MDRSISSSLRPLAATIAPLRLPPRESLECVHAMGYHAVQLCVSIPGLQPRELDRAARRGLKSECDRMGMPIGGIDCFIGEERFLDPATVDRAAGALERAIGMAGELGRVCVSTSLPRDIPPEVRAALEVAASRVGVLIADFGTEAPSGAIGTGIDPAAILSRGEDPVALAVRAGACLCGLRMVDLSADGMRVPPFQSSRLDALALVTAMAVGGFQNHAVSDARQWKDPSGGLRSTLEAWMACGTT